MIIEFKIYENIYPDSDPYGEENWDDDYISLNELIITMPLRCKKEKWELKEGKVYFVLRVYNDRVLMTDYQSLKYSLDEIQLNELFKKIK